MPAARRHRPTGPQWVALALAAGAIALPAGAQTPDLADFEAVLEDAGWSVGFMPALPQGPVTGATEAQNIRLQRGERVLLADRLRLDAATWPYAFELEDVRLLDLGREGRSGEITAARLGLSHVAALDLLEPGIDSRLDLCAGGWPDRLALQGTDVTLRADPDALAVGQSGAESVTMREVALTTARQDLGGACAVSLQGSLEAVRAQAADGTEGQIGRLHVEAETRPAEGALTRFEFEMADLGARNGNRLLIAADLITLQMSGSGLAQLLSAPAGQSGPLLGQLFAAEAEVILLVSGAELPLADLLPEDLALPPQFLAANPGGRLAGSFGMMVRLGEAGAAALGGEMAVSGLADMKLDLAAEIPQSAGGAEMLPGVPAELAGIALRRAELSLLDRGLDSLLRHYSGAGLQAHAAQTLRPAGRILPGEVMTVLQAGVEDWIARALENGAWLELAPDEPVSLTQLGSLIFFAPDGVPELLGLRIER